MSGPGPTLGIDIGGTKVRSVVLGGLDGTTPLWWDTTPTPPVLPPRDAVVLVADVAARAAREVGQPVAGIGIGFPGLVVRSTGIVRSSVIIAGWADVPFAAMVTAAVGVPCLVDNDVNNTALAESAARSAGGDVADLLVISIGTGIGGAVVLGGQVWSGVSGLAGEVGHMSGGVPDAACTCGGRACLVNHAGGRALERELGIDAASLAGTLAHGSTEASQAVAAAAAMVGRVAADAMNLLNLPLVCLGGGLAEVDGFVAAADRAFRAFAMSEVAEACRVERCIAGYDAGAVGAALLARR